MYDSSLQALIKIISQVKVQQAVTTINVGISIKVKSTLYFHIVFIFMSKAGKLGQIHITLKI